MPGFTDVFGWENSPRKAAGDNECGFIELLLPVQCVLSSITSEGTSGGIIEGEIPLTSKSESGNARDGGVGGCGMGSIVGAMEGAKGVFTGFRRPATPSRRLGGSFELVCVSFVSLHWNEIYLLRIF